MLASVSPSLATCANWSPGATTAAQPLGCAAEGCRPARSALERATPTAVYSARSRAKVAPVSLTCSTNGAIDCTSNSVKVGSRDERTVAVGGAG